MKDLRQRMSLRMAALVLLFVGGWGCSKKSETTAEQAAPQPSAQEEFRFVEKFTPDEVAQGIGKNKNRYEIFFSEDSLNQRFLLQSNMSQQTVAPMFTNMRSVIVRFEKHGNILRMFEDIQGHLAVRDLDTKLLRAEFPILFESGGWMAVDFNEGMRRLFVTSDWQASDLDGGDYPAEKNWVSIPAAASYIDHVSFSKKALWIKQVANFAAGMNSVPLLVNYYLEPYAPSANFTAQKTKGFDQFGFFEVNPILNGETNGTDIFVTKFDHSNPIQWAISSNTPAEYRDAIREGVLYWNKAFGKQILEVVDAPAGVSAPHPDFNIIQWADWKNAGFAYADAQMDPLTGQTLHGQIFLPSTWAWMGINRSYKQVLLNDEGKEKQKIMGLKGFLKPSVGCAFEPSVSDFGKIHRLMAQSSKQDLNHFANDYIRVVVAHEVGHVLGLRHNFAGSTAANYSVKDRKEIFNKYILEKTADETLLPGSTVMDYPQFEEDVLQANWLKNNSKALPYDRAAILALYDGKTIPKEITPPYCSDMKVDDYIDCRVHDFGRNVFEIAQNATVNSVDQIAYMVLMSILMHKIDTPEKPIQQVALPSAKEWANQTARGASQILSAVTKNRFITRIGNMFPEQNGEMLETQNTLMESLLGEEYRKFSENHADLQSLLALPSKSFNKEFGSYLNVLFEKQFTVGKNTAPTGETFELSYQEFAALKFRLQNWVKKYSEELDLAWLENLAGKTEQPLRRGSLAQLYIQQVQNLANEILTSHQYTQLQIPVQPLALDSGFRLVANEEPAKQPESASPQEKKPATQADSPKPEETLKLIETYELPKFEYSMKVRKAAAKILSSLESEDSLPLFLAKEVQKENLTAFYKSILKGGDLSSLKPIEIKDPLKAAWVLENQDLLSSVN